MAHARTAPAETTSRGSPSLLRLTLVALVLALAFDAVSTAIAWNVIRALPGTVRRGPVHTVRPTEVRDPSPLPGPDAPENDAPAH
jgi:hypothetical protein